MSARSASQQAGVRLGLISDLHATRTTLLAVLAELERVGVDRIVCLGDIVDLGPSPQDVVDIVRERGIPCVLGNHDTLDEHPPLAMLQEIEAWTLDRLDADTLAWLAGLPPTLDEHIEGVHVLHTHGSLRDVREQISESTPESVLEQLCDARAFDLMTCGHTHVQCVRHARGRTFVNVGSVGMPFREVYSGRPPRVKPCAEYAILTCAQSQTSVELSRVPLDRAALEDELRDAGFPEWESWLRHWD